MKSLICLLVASAALLGVEPLAGQAVNDFQVRTLAHVQLVPKGRGLGFAGWGVVPDITQTRSLRGLFVGGILYRGNGRWVEVMGGGLASRSSVDPILDVRVSEQSLGKIHGFAAVQHAFKARRLVAQPIVTTPFTIGQVRVGIGGEADIVLALGRLSTARGPRVEIQVPLCKKICKSASFALAHLFRSDGVRIVRTYFLLNL